MTETIEIEYKNLLTQAEYHSLILHFQIPKQHFFSQLNCYFDTSSGELKKQKMGLRIRIKVENAELTLKSPAASGLLETTDLLKKAEALEYIQQKKIPEDGSVAKKLQDYRIDLSSLQMIGQLKTERAEIQLDKSLLVLDESWYGQEHDYELEMEFAESTQSERIFKDFLNTQNIPHRPALNKVQRMLKSVQKLTDC